MTMLKSILLFIAFLSLPIACVSEQGKTSPSEYTAITDVTIIDGKGTQPQPDMVVVLKDRNIHDIAKFEGYKLPENTKIIDGKGKFIIPGLIDTHAHVTVLPIDDNKNIAKNYDKEASLASLKTMVAFGVLTVRNPAAPTKDGVELRDLVKNDVSIVSPEIFTSGAALNRVESNFGPFVATPTEAAVREEVKRQIAVGVNYIKVYSSLKPNLVKAAIDEAHKGDVKVVGHLQNTSWTEAANLGIDSITHAAPWHKDYLPNSYRDKYRPSFLGRLDWIEKVNYEESEIQELLDSMLKNNVAFDPTLIVFHTKFWGNDPKYAESEDLELAHPTVLKVWKSASFIGDWKASDFERAQKLWDKLAKLTKIIHEKGVLVTAGTDFPDPWVLPGKSLHQEMKLLSNAGISNLEVLKIATFNGAKSLGIEDRKGTIEKGRIADLLLLTADPLKNIQNTEKIDAVIKSGTFYKPSDLLAN